MHRYVGNRRVAAMVKVYRTHYRKCPCGGTLTKKGVIAAKCFDVNDVSAVKWQQYQCAKRACRKPYAPNFFYKGGARTNTAADKDIEKA